ncbi:hypothetical protein AADY36_19115 [Pseudoalteromonas sp. D15MCD-2]|uniref:hypothetical protein n=1 Tax=Pseudoalteromonas sp. D15MCD-2 TaxID=3138933 RepID=UPI00315802F1
MYKNLSIVVLSTLITACAGGTIGGLLPAPKILDGKMEGLTYTSPLGELTIKAPATEEGGEWTYTQVKEHSENHADQKSTFVGFKTPYDSHFYTAEVVSYKNNETLNHDQFLLVISDNLKRVIKSTEERWKSKVQQLNETNIICENNKTFTYSIFKQTVTSYDPNFEKFYLISQSFESNSIAIVTSELNYDLRQTIIPEENIKNAKYVKHQEFVCSLKYGV